MRLVKTALIRFVCILLVFCVLTCLFASHLSIAADSELASLMMLAKSGRVTVTYVLDDDTTEKVRIEKGTVIEKEDLPKKEGYYFGGWFYDAELKEPFWFGTSVAKSITLYAKWEEIPTPDEEWDNPFEDVVLGEWYFGEVRYNVENGLMDGVADNRFGLDGDITREDFVTVIWKMAGSPVVNYIMPFGDVDAESHSLEAIRWAASEKLVLGFTDTEFAPDKAITNEQMATVLYRYAKARGDNMTIDNPVMPRLSDFKDANDVSEYARDAVDWVVARALLKGEEKDMFAPHSTMTRAHAAAFFRRVHSPAYYTGE